MKRLVLPFLTLITFGAISITANSAALCASGDENTVSIGYLGVGALDIHYKGQRILTDPFYSPQSLWDIISFTPYVSSKQHIEKALGNAQQDVSAILIGHGHYDHAADLPALQEYLKQDAQILVSQSTAFLLSPTLSHLNFTHFNSENFNQWQWIADGFIRVKAIPSEHAPQALGINLFPAIHQHPVDEAPKYVWDWSQGTNLTWLMDFMAAPKGTEVVKRIFIQTSASRYPVGVPEISDGIEVDQVYLAAASFDHVENYPTGLIQQLKPQQIIFIHWENFFKPWFEAPQALSLIDFEKLMSQQVLANHANATIGQPNNCY